MRYVSVCSGIESASVAWEPLGWTPVAFAETDAFPSAVLAHRFPGVPNVGDMTAADWASYAPVDILVGGPPCQSFSVAGKRGGLADARGSLLLRTVDVAHAVRARWVVIENVPGLLSADGGRAFAALLSRLVERGYGWAYRILDARHFGVPQRRRRVFVVGRAGGDWQCAAQVLFEPACLRGDLAAGGQAGEDVAGTVAGGARRSGGYSTDDVPMTAHTLRGDGHDAGEDGTGRGTPLIAFSSLGYGQDVGSDISPTLRVGSGKEIPGGAAIAFTSKDHGADAGELAPTLRAMGHAGSHANGGGQVAVAVALRGREGGATAELGDDQANALRASQGGGDKAYVATFDERNITSKGNRSEVAPGKPCHTLHESAPSVIGSGVRRLTPVECERLQGFPDGWTAIPWKGRPAAECPDGPRYKAVGNSMAVPVLRWLGERIQLVEAES